MIMALLLDRRYCFCGGRNTDVLIDPRVEKSRISTTFSKALDNSFEGAAGPTDGVSLRPGSVPIVVSTRRGVYVTACPIVVAGSGQPDVVLGQDWLKFTRARLSSTLGFVEDCHSSWGNSRVAWFSWAFQPGALLCFSQNRTTLTRPIDYWH